ncbi:MAG: CotS family spore coat protein [Bacillota bacterium]|nr:CotS family spore coat protein [Bacillota bacterium]
MELLKYNLEDELFNNYDLAVSEAVPNRKVYLLFTDHGEKYLKKIDYPVNELHFIYNSLLYISEKFDRVVSFYKTKKGDIYTNYKGNNYTILNKVEGREGSFLNPVDISYMTAALRELHSASRGLKTEIIERNKTGDLIKNLKNKLCKLELFYNIGSITNTDFSKLFIKYYKKYEEEAKKSISILESSDYFKLCSDEKYISLNHHDLAHHNVIINGDKAYFIDFDYSIIDLRVHDISNFINKTNRNFNYDFEKCKSILNEYNKEDILSPEEIKVLFGMLLFPIDVYNLAYNYFTKNKLWQEEDFLSRLRDKTEKNEFREMFLNEFQKIC